MTFLANLFQNRGITRTHIKPITLATLWLTLTASVLVAQELDSPEDPAVAITANENPSAGTIVFSNLDTDGSYNPDAFAAKAVAGREAGGGQDEEWYAVRFIPKVDVQVKQLSAAIGYVSGDKLVNLTLYDNNDIFDTPGNPLPAAAAARGIFPIWGSAARWPRSGSLEMAYFFNPGLPTGWWRALMTSEVQLSAENGTYPTSDPTLE